MNKNAEENAMKQAGIELIKRAAREAGHASTPPPPCMRKVQASSRLLYCMKTLKDL